MDLLSDISGKPRLASIGIRIGAAIIDLLLIWIVGIILGRLFGTPLPRNEGFGFQLQGWPALLWFALIFCLMPLQEGLTGKTTGKRLAGIRVVKDDYTTSATGASIIRHFFDFVDFFLFVGLIVAATNPKKQRVGDLVAKTLVING